MSEERPLSVKERLARFENLANKPQEPVRLRQRQGPRRRRPHTLNTFARDELEGFLNNHLQNRPLIPEQRESTPENSPDDSPVESPPREEPPQQNNNQSSLEFEETKEKLKLCENANRQLQQDVKKFESRVENLHFLTHQMKKLVCNSCHEEAISVAYVPCGHGFCFNCLNEFERPAK
ncbi:Oidioi.mRNA.OKI2018_I69.chr1.g899.t1.cds [Oikopleura dioica]|uniref:Oidioi.mRNA.OKI2018_I69.chr1.g899.t1.cds n=1 Tax=Oikopleura dioica TaxID=34765 RepID=A0ABN7SN22_OIKDI|nr:Oidioi.mRNA.OKI2018_I69.chr1.g899.t1.cds [Oikopleura dioica]